jgi:peptidoglycan/LPS O-acetylase OafA/YrhL
MKYRSEIDGLRALAVIPVILFHAGFSLFSGGFVGVDVFFVISGYLITTILISEMDEKRFSLVNFYERRARRILPVLFFVILCCLPFAWFLMLPSGMEAFSRSLVAVTLFGSNFLFWSESGYFDISTHYKPLLHTWSLAVEEQYYVFFPLFLMAFWRFGKSKILWILLFSFTFSLVIAYWGVINKPNASFYLLPFRAWELLLGAFAGFYLHSKMNGSAQVKASITQEALSLLGISLILFSMLTIGKDINSISLYALMPTVGATLIILFGTSNTLAGQILSFKPLVWIGLISYSAYLWHQPIFAFARHASLTEPSKITFLSLTLVVLLLSWWSWKYIENPFRNKDKFNQKRIFKLSIFGSLIVMSIGLAGVISNGYLSRYSIQDQYLASLNPRSAGDYVAKRFLSLSLNQFDLDNKKTKVLVIGDSYAEDLINSMYEAGLDENYQFSTRHISKKCGNLYLPFDSFKKNVNSEDVAFCEKKALTTDSELKKIIANADEIWFASAWQYWQAELIQESLNNVDVYKKKIRVFGLKSFGDIDIKKILASKAKDRSSLNNKPSKDSIKTNQFLRSNLKSEVFVDVEDLMCDKRRLSCPLFTSENKLISYDGGHLTQSGAKLLGRKLKEKLLSD